MKAIRTALALALTTLAVGCEQEPGNAEPAPTADASAGKADDAQSSGCAAIQEDYEGCEWNTPDGFSCEEYLNGEHPDAVECCANGQEYGFCDISGSAWCQSVVDDLTECYDASTEEACLQHQETQYPLFELCGNAFAGTSCVDIAEDFANCEANSGADVSCESYLQETYPWAAPCCHEDVFADACHAFDCTEIIEVFYGCEENARPDVLCDDLLQEDYAWGEGCCSFEGFDETICAAYG